MSPSRIRTAADGIAGPPVPSTSCALVMQVMPVAVFIDHLLGRSGIRMSLAVATLTA